MTTDAMTNLFALRTLAASDPVQHVIDHPTYVGSDGVWWWSSHMTMLWLGLGLLVALGIWAAKRITTGPESEGHDRYITRNPFAHMIEVICLFLRDEIVEPLLHGNTRKFMPFLWTLFFFILTLNLLGLVPLLDLTHLLFREQLAEKHLAVIGGTATQNIFVTGALALIAGVVINVAGMRELGIGGYLHHMTAGAPWYVWPLVIPIELVGQIIKPTALAIRLFANMTAGHILLAQIMIFAGLGGAMLTVGKPVGGVVWLFATLGAVAIFFLEIFVAFLQAFIFMFLTAVFISLLQHHDEEHHEDAVHGGAEHGHDAPHAVSEGLHTGAQSPAAVRPAVA